MKQRWKLTVLSVTLILCLVPLVWGLSSKRATEEENNFTSKTAPIVITAAVVKEKSMPITVEALGSLSAVQIVKISSVVDGRISKIYFKDGQKIEEGNTIVQLDNTKAKADYESSITSFNLAAVKYKRFKQLLYTAVSRQELDQLKASLATQEASAKSKLAELNQKQIDASFTGVLGAFKVHEGDYIKAGEPLVTLVNTSKLRVNYNLPEDILPKLKLEQTVKVTVNAYPDKVFYGSVNFISPTVDQSTRMVAVQALIPNPKNLLSSGMFVHVSHKIGTKEGALVIPEQAVTTDVKGYFTYKIIGNKVAQTYIKTGSRVKGTVQIVKGLAAGDKVATARLSKLEDGSIIEIAESNASNENSGRANSSTSSISSTAEGENVPSDVSSNVQTQS